MAKHFFWGFLHWTKSSFGYLFHKRDSHHALNNYMEEQLAKFFELKEAEMRFTGKNPCKCCGQKEAKADGFCSTMCMTKYRSTVRDYRPSKEALAHAEELRRCYMDLCIMKACRQPFLQ